MALGIVGLGRTGGNIAQRLTLAGLTDVQPCFAGSGGPAADGLMERDGRRWRRLAL